MASAAAAASAKLQKAVAAGDPDDLAKAVESALASIDKLRRMGRPSQAVAASLASNVATWSNTTPAPMAIAALVTRLRPTNSTEMDDGIETAQVQLSCVRALQPLLEATERWPMSLLVAFLEDVAGPERWVDAQPAQIIAGAVRQSLLAMVGAAPAGSRAVGRFLVEAGVAGREEGAEASLPAVAP